MNSSRQPAQEDRPDVRRPIAIRRDRAKRWRGVSRTRSRDADDKHMSWTEMRRRESCTCSPRSLGRTIGVGYTVENTVQLHAHFTRYCERVGASARTFHCH